MPHFYIDSSALVKRYYKETGSDFLNLLYKHLEIHSSSLFSSELTDVEFTSTMFRLTREQKITTKEAISIIYSYEIESIHCLNFIVLDYEVLLQSKNILSIHPLKSHDAIQLASAMEARNYHDDIYFVADDEKLCKAAEQEGFVVLRPRMNESMTTLMMITSES